MKKSIFTCIAMAILFLSACKKDSSTAAPITTANVSSTVASGTWRVTYYWDTDHDETVNFTGYAFTFGSGNVLTATKAGTSLPGNWATDTDDAQVKLILVFSSPVNFAKISDDWHVTERTDTKIKLEDVSGGGSGTDYLTFEKN